MSIELTLKLCTPLRLNSLPEEIGSTLQWLLNLTFTPVVTAEGYWNWQRRPLQIPIIEKTSRPILIAIENEPEAVVVGPFSVMDNLDDSGDQNDYVYVNVGSQRTPLEHALAVATAVTIGRQLGTAVLDDGCYYTKALEISPNDLVACLRVPRASSDYGEAARLFYAALPSGAAPVEAS